MGTSFAVEALAQVVYKQLKPICLGPSKSLQMIRLLFLFATLLAALYAKSFTMPTRSSGSLRAKMISKGQYQQYLKNQRTRRLQIFKGSQPFIDYADDFYLGEVQIGTPAQNMTLVLDTGSSNLWVIDDACQSAACNGNTESGYIKHKFETSESKTFKKESRSFSMSYGSGSCNGYLATDAVSFAGMMIFSWHMMNLQDI
ncbi:unnamed protein product [Strongylus vulgaris]|uniref:Peptidase A1 domain-containing protein n=1 Tax=Strongylus vulgaris TaxID=40348 RepID=A0A3P7JIG2_STRVU|nr:unnamed protein product [Strongylus vulgaris]